MAYRNWNPNEPYILGMEWPGMRTIAAPLAPGTEYGHTFQADATEAIDKVAFLLVPPEVPATTSFLGAYPNPATTALVTVYEVGNELATGSIQSTMCAVNGGSLVGDAFLSGGASSVLDALASSSDEKGIHMPSDLSLFGSAILEFATSGLFAGKRILEVRLHYVATQTNFPFATPLDPTICTLTTSDPGATTPFAFLGSPMAIDHALDTPQVRIVSLGEVNYRSGAAKCWPWTINDVTEFDTGAVEFTISPGNSTTTGYGITLRYAALEIVWCEENREAVGAVFLGAPPSVFGYIYTPEFATLGTHEVFLRTPDGTDNWTKATNEEYAITITSPVSPGPFEFLGELGGQPGFQTQGSQPFVPLVDAFTLNRVHYGRVMPRALSGVVTAAENDTRLCPFKLTTTSTLVPLDFDPYDRAIAARVANTSQYSPISQQIEQRSGGAIAYPYVRFYARVVGEGAQLDVTSIVSYVGITAEQILAEPEIWDGWRQITLEFSPHPTFVNDSSNRVITFDVNSGDVSNSIEILGVSSIGFISNENPTYGRGDTRATWTWQGESVPTAHASDDLVVTVHTEPPAIAGFSVDTTTIELTGAGLYCQGPIVGEVIGYVDEYVDEYIADFAGGDNGYEPCTPREVVVPYLTWTPTIIGGTEFSYYEIQRRDNIDTEFQTVAKLTNNDASFWRDHEARVNETSTYRMRIMRSDGIAGIWTSQLFVLVTTGDLPVPSGSLYFTSNVDQTLSPIAYGQWFDGAPIEGFEFVEADSVQLQRLYGRYGTQSFHPTERGGVRFDRSLITNALASISRTASDGFLALRDLAWADIPYVCVKDDLGNRWYSTLIVPSGTMRRSKEIYVAQVRVIESTDVPFPADTVVPTG